MKAEDKIVMPLEPATGQLYASTPYTWYAAMLQRDLLLP